MNSSEIIETKNATTTHAPRSNEIRTMFASIASRYDQANSVLSLGIHHLWRKKLVSLCHLKEGAHVLDCATGTGDLAIEFKRAVGGNGKVIGSDFCAEMLERAPTKAKKLNLDIEFEIADVTELPYDNESFDVVSIAFGIRNVENTQKALLEMHRVLKPGGKLAILEFGQPKLPILKQAFRFYSDKVLPTLGGLVTGKAAAYRYLEKSSSKFPCRENFVKLINSTTDFSATKFYSLSGGIAYIYIAQK